MSEVPPLVLPIASPTGTPWLSQHATRLILILWAAGMAAYAAAFADHPPPHWLAVMIGMLGPVLGAASPGLRTPPGQA